MIKKALIAGTTAAAIEGILVYASDPQTDRWVLAQSVLFWFSCGFVVSMIRVEKNKILTSVLLTMLLCLPWYIALTVVAPHPEHLLPLIVSSLVMGIVIGFLSRRLDRVA